MPTSNGIRSLVDLQGTARLKSSSPCRPAEDARRSLTPERRSVDKQIIGRKRFVTRIDEINALTRQWPFRHSVERSTAGSELLPAATHLSARSQSSGTRPEFPSWHRNNPGRLFWPSPPTDQLILLRGSLELSRAPQRPLSSRITLREDDPVMVAHSPRRGRTGQSTRVLLRHPWVNAVLRHDPPACRRLPAPAIPAGLLGQWQKKLLYGRFNSFTLAWKTIRRDARPQRQERMKPLGWDPQKHAKPGPPAGEPLPRR